MLQCLRGIWKLVSRASARTFAPTTTSSCQDIRADDVISRLAMDLTKFMTPTELMAFETASSFVNKCASVSWQHQLKNNYPGMISQSADADAKARFFSTRKAVYQFPGRDNKPSLNLKGKMKIEKAFTWRDEVELAFKISTKDANLYFEVFVGTTANLWLKLQTDAANRTITFNPATGEVRQGKQIKKVLPCVEPEKELDGLECRYLAFVGVYISNGKVAFTRRFESAIECSGFLEEFHLFDGECVTPRFVFQRPVEGTKGHCGYHAIINEVSSAPPMKVELGRKPLASRWLSFRYWDRLALRHTVRMLERFGLYERLTRGLSDS
eukprot:TRINITY_DN49910_c0_g1_i1.p1 TRINITY_DN49910_c0_g1~~TRINITY_DN49910_c0_g1_i1.p1  ORF type:complete len:325 (-),score=49.23 TRINITY_DN49910_c0_g1_i1:9-983(-)